MTSRRSVVVVGLFCAALVLGGCSTLKKFTGQRDDTVLPGDREDVLPPQRIEPPEQDVARKKICPPEDTKCLEGQQGQDGTVQ